MQPITALTGVVLNTTRLEEMTAFYSERFGLEALRLTADCAWLASAGAAGPELILRKSAERRFGGLVLAMANDADVQLSMEQANTLGLKVCNADPGVDGGRGFTIRDPDANALTFIVRSKADASALPARPKGPVFMSHVVLNSDDPARLIDFYVAKLGFKISDRYERDLLTFLRCDQPQHHCVGVAPAAAPGLNHFAMDCENVDGVMRSVSRMAQQAQAPIWGPGRHAPGGNIFCYFEDPDGFVCEFTSDVLQIPDDREWAPQVWLRTPENGNTWGSGPPSPRAVELMDGSAFCTGEGPTHAGVGA